MGEQALARHDARFGRREPAPKVHDVADALDPPGVAGDGAHEAHLDVGRRVARAGRQRGVHGAAGGRVDQRGGQAAVDHADRVVVLLAGLDGEDDMALADLDELEAHEGRDRRRRELARDHRPHGAEAVELGEVARGLDGVVASEVMPRRAAERAPATGAGSGAAPARA